MRYSGIIIVFILAAYSISAHARVVDPPEIVTKDITWFEVTNNWLITCRGDGLVRVVDYNTGTIRADFILNNYDLASDKLFVSFKDVPLLAIVNSKGRITVYDLLSSKQLWSKVKDNDNIEINGQGFSIDGDRLYYNSSHTNADIYCLNAHNGRILWLLADMDYKGTAGNLLIPKNEDLFVQIFAGDVGETRYFWRMIARDKAGETKWVRKDIVQKWTWYDDYFGAKYISDTYATAPNPVIPSDIALLHNLKGKDNSILAISLNTGEDLWTKKLGDEETLWAVNTDRSRQVFWESGKVKITRLPDPNEVVLKDTLSNDYDAVITPNGRYLFLLPKLQDAKRQVFGYRHLNRKSNIFQIFDCETGEKVKEIALLKLTDSQFENAKIKMKNAKLWYPPAADG